MNTSGWKCIAMRTMTKSPVALAKKVIRTAKAALPDYSSVYSRHAFSQHRLFVVLVLRQFLKTDYRRIIQMLKDFSDGRIALGQRRHLAIPPFAMRRNACSKKGF